MFHGAPGAPSAPGHANNGGNNSLLDEDCFVDDVFTFSCAGASDTDAVVIRASKVLLAAASPFFERFFTSFGTDIRGITFASSNANANFGHLGAVIKLSDGDTEKIPVDSDVLDLAGIARLATDLEMEDVTDKVLNYLTLNNNNCSDVLRVLLLLGDNSNSSEVETYCIKYLAINMDLVPEESLLSLPGLLLTKIFSRDELDIPDEVDVWKLVKKWLDRNSDCDPGTVSMLLSSVRFGLIPRRFLKSDPWLEGRLMAITLSKLVGADSPRTPRCRRIVIARVQSNDFYASGGKLKYTISDMGRISGDISNFCLPLPRVLERQQELPPGVEAISVVASPFRANSIIVAFMETSNVGGPYHSNDMYILKEVVEFNLEKEDITKTTLSLTGLPDESTNKCLIADLMVLNSSTLAMDYRLLNDSEREVLGKIYVYNREEQRWECTREVHNNRFGFISMLMGGDGHSYILTGAAADGAFGLVKSVHRWNTITGSYEFVGELLQERWAPEWCWWKGGILVAFGWKNEEGVELYDTLEYFDVAGTKTSRVLTTFPVESLLRGGDESYAKICPIGSSDGLLVALKSINYDNDDDRIETGLFVYDGNEWKRMDSGRLLPPKEDLFGMSVLEKDRVVDHDDICSEVRQKRREENKWQFGLQRATFLACSGVLTVFGTILASNNFLTS